MKEQILEWCKTLAKSQGLYRRLLEELENNSTKLNTLATECEGNDIENIVDFVMLIES